MMFVKSAFAGAALAFAWGGGWAIACEIFGGWGFAGYGIVSIGAGLGLLWAVAQS